jgi:hypothetical protein
MTTRLKPGEPIWTYSCSLDNSRSIGGVCALEVSRKDHRAPYDAFHRVLSKERSWHRKRTWLLGRKLPLSRIGAYHTIHLDLPDFDRFVSHRA